MVLGANHNFFNTEWTPGHRRRRRRGTTGTAAAAICGSQLADPAERRASSGRSAWRTSPARPSCSPHDAQDFLPLFDGSRRAPAVDRRAPTSGRTPSAAAASCGARRSTPGCRCRRAPRPRSARASCRSARSARAAASSTSTGRCPHWYDSGEFAPARRELEMTWTEAGQTGGLVFDEPLDLSSRPARAAHDRRPGARRRPDPAAADRRRRATPP